MDNYYEQHHGKDLEESTGKDFRDYLQIISKRKGLIFSITLLVFLASFIKTYTATPYFTASANILVERNESQRTLDLLPYRYDPDFLLTQSEIIKSVNVSRKVVRSLALDTDYRKHFFPDNNGSKSSFNFINGFVKSLINIPMSLISESREILISGGIESNRSQGSLLSDEELIARMISGRLNVSPLGETDIVSISFTDRDPGMAEMIVNAVVSAYIEEMLEIKLAASSYSLQWMTAKAEVEREKLEKSEKALQKYMRDNDLVTIEDSLAVYPQRLNELSVQLSRSEASRRELESLLSQIDEAGGDYQSLENITIFADNTVLKVLRNDIYSANQKIKDLAQKYGPKHPVMIQAKDELTELTNKRRTEVDRIVASTKNAYQLAVSKENDLRELIEETKSDVLDLNEKFIQYSTLKREVESKRQMYDLLQSSISRQDITEESASVNIWVVKKADRPSYPSSPNKKRDLMLGLFLGLLGGVGLAMLIEYLDNTVKSEMELEQRYGLTVLGSVENISKAEDNIETHVLAEPLSPLAESYRLIRSGLLLSSAEKPPTVVLVTSMGAKEGKTSTTLNLARILEQGGKRVAIMDCDLRRPRMHTVVGVENKVGLSSYLSGMSDDSGLVNIPGENLMLIPSGPIPPNPAELLNSRRMEQLLDKFRDQCDFVLLDSSPVQSVTDSLALSNYVDGTIIVVRFGKTTHDMLNAGMKKLLDVNANLLGFVLNGLNKKDARGYYYGYQSYYYTKKEGKKE